MANYINSIQSEESRVVELEKILTAIKHGYWSEQILTLRNFKESGNVEGAQQQKRNLPAFTVSAEYKGRRVKDSVSKYKGLIQLDFDNINDVEESKRLAICEPYTYSAFVSPSGNGLKIFVRVDIDKEDHLKYFTSVKSHYDTLLGETSDPSVKDILRLCFVSYDPELYLNKDADCFEMAEFAQSGSTKDVEWIYNFTKRQIEFIEGSRNKFVYQFACNANRFGLDKSILLNYCTSLASPSFDFKEIVRTVDSAYHSNGFEFNKNSTNATLDDSIAWTSSSSLKVGIDTPLIPQWVYDNLPEPIKTVCLLFTDRERDIVLLSTLSTLSGALQVHSKYGKEKVFANLFTLIVANAASGKGVMKYSRMLVQPYHDELKKQSAIDLNEWKKRVSTKKKGGDNSNGWLEKPNQRVYLLPGDTTTSKLLEHLQGLEGYGCIHETESDSIGKVLKKEHSNYSDILRKAYHGESVSISRKEEGRFTEIKEPKFSATISGTPGQFSGLVKSIEDGLVSRMMIYYFQKDPVWKTTFYEEAGNTLIDQIESAGKVISRFLQEQKPREVKITRNQGDRRDMYFKVHYPLILKDYGEEMASIVTRLGVSSHKIAMVLSAFRSDEEVVQVDDRDFDIGLAIATEVLLPHALTFLKPMNMGSTMNTQNLANSFYSMIPEIFDTNEIEEVVGQLGISIRTRNSLLKNFVEDGRIIRLKRGSYRKV